jgi:hypothetical protein
MTIAVREESGSFCCSVEEVTSGAADAAEDIVLSPVVFADARSVRQIQPPLWHSTGTFPPLRSV